MDRVPGGVVIRFLSPGAVKKKGEAASGRGERTGLSPFLRVANSSAESIILTILEPWGGGETAGCGGVPACLGDVSVRFAEAR